MAESLTFDCLFEYGKFKRVFPVNDGICEAISDYLSFIGFDDATVFLSGASTECVPGRAVSRPSQEAGVKGGKFVLQKWNQKWNSFVEVSSIEEITPDCKLTAMHLHNPRSPMSSVDDSTSKAAGVCNKLGRVSEHSAKALKKLFPSTASFKANKRNFNPLDECLVEGQKKKKKSSSTRSKLRSLQIVYLKEVSVHVPRGYQRGLLTKQGRTNKQSFSRNMKPNEVKSCVIEAFPYFDELKDKIVFLRCGRDNRLRVVENEVNGDDIFELAGQGSIYISSGVSFFKG